MQKTTSQGSESPATRERMSGEARRADVLAVARRVFEERGYRTTTRVIAEEAGVSEALVLKHFDSKENLFRVAVFGPLLDLLSQELEHGRRRVPAGAVPDDLAGPQVILSFLRRLAGLVRDERALLMTAVADLRRFPDVEQRVGRMIAEAVEESAQQIGRAGDWPFYERFDPQVASATAFAVAVVAGMFSDTPDEFIEEFVRILFLGLLSEEGRQVVPEELRYPARVPRAGAGSDEQTSEEGG